MLVSELITWANDMHEPGETTPDISDAKWMRLFNEGISKCKDYGLIEQTYYADIVSGTSRYSIPSDCVDLTALYISEDGETYEKIERVNVKPSLRENEYFIYDNEINIYEPSSDVTDGLKLYYYRNHTEITATTQTLEYNDDYVLGYYALSRLALQNRSKEDYEIYFNEFLQARQDLDSREIMPATEIEAGW